MYNTTHSFMNKTNNPGANSSFNNNSLNLSHNIGSVPGHEKKLKKYSTNSNKHVKQAAYHSYTNMAKKKHPRASSNNDTNPMPIYKHDERLNKSSKKKKNILFKLANELSHSPDTVKVRKAYGKERKKKDNQTTVKASCINKAIPTFGISGDCSGNRMNTEATDDASLNSGRNRSKKKPGTALYEDKNQIPTIALDDDKTPDSKGGLTISYNNDFDTYNKSRNEDAITCKRDCSKYVNLSNSHTSNDGLNKNVEGQLKKRINYLQSSNENVFQNDLNESLDGKNSKQINASVVDCYDQYFEQAAAPLEELARNNPSIAPLLKLVRKGYEDICHKIINEDRLKLSMAQESNNKYKREVSRLKQE